MTCIEKYMAEHPKEDKETVMLEFCPNEQGGFNICDPEYCEGIKGRECVVCWNRQIPGDENKLKVMLDPGAILPRRAHSADAGLDLYSPIATVVFPRRKNGSKNSVVIDTGVHIAIPGGYVGDVKSKSGLMVNDDIITDGTVDAGYTGSIRVKLFNLGVKPVHIEAGQKIAQLVIKKIITPGIKVVDSLEETERGSGGFGSTGKF